MGLSLADAAVRGTTSDTIASRKQSLLEAGDTEGLIALNHSIFGSTVMMAKDDADDDTDDEDDDDGDDDEDDEDDDEDEDDEDDKGKRKQPSRLQRRIQELSAESKKYRLKASQRGKRIADLEAEVERLKAGPAKGKKQGKDEDDEDDDESANTAEATRLKKENEALQERLVTQTLRTEFLALTSGTKPLAQFANPNKAFRLLDLDEVEIDEDGDIVGLDDAIKALAKSDPYLLAKNKGDDDEDDEDDEDEVTKRRRRKAGQPTGGTRKKGNPNRDKLISKYPALRR